MIQKVKIRSYSQKNVCYSLVAQCGPAGGCTLQTWHLWHPAEFEVTHISTQSKSIGSGKDGHPRSKLSVKNPGIQDTVLKHFLTRWTMGQEIHR